jgi:small subunit ribosomal protein S20
MANTRTATKRARQALTRQARNIQVRSQTKSAVKIAVDSLHGKKGESSKGDYLNAVKTLSKAASKGAIPKRRAARKISRLTRLAKKTHPAILTS